MMATLTTFIVDDERLARDELRFLLADHPEAEVVGEADGVDAAREALVHLQPDVIFLDVQLRGESGLDLLDYVPASSKIIFVTGFEEQALQELETKAFEYLLKPVNPARLARVLERLAHNGAGAPAAG